MRDAFNEFITSKKALPFDTPKSNLRWNNSESKVCVIGVDDVGHVVVAVIRCEITAITSQERSLAKSSAAASHSSLQTLLQFNGCQSRCTLRYLHHCHMAVDERSHSATNQSVCATIYAFIHWIHALVENARAKWAGRVRRVCRTRTRVKYQSATSTTTMIVITSWKCGQSASCARQRSMNARSELIEWRTSAWP